MTDERFFLGVDGGATRCRARLRDSRGLIRAEAEGPAANVYVSFDTAVEVASRVVGEALAKGGILKSHTSYVSLGLGLAGMSEPDDKARFAAAFPGFADVRVVNDAVTACIGAHGGADGGLLIAGTGSAGIARVAGRETIVGGRGFLLGDDGSAARIGADALRAAVRAFDGLSERGALTEAVLARFDANPIAMIVWATSAKPGDYGAFAPLVLDHAARGDAIALSIVEAAAHAIAALASAIERLGAPRIAMVGGLGAAIRPFLARDVNAKIHEPLFDPTDGAVILAGGRVGDASRGEA